MEKQRRPLDGPPPLPNAKGDTEVSRPPFTEDMKAARREKAEAFKRKAEAKPGPPPLDPIEREIAGLEPLPGIKAKPEAKKENVSQRPNSTTARRLQPPHRHRPRALELDRHRAPRRRRESQAPRMRRQGVEYRRAVLPWLMGTSDGRSAVRFLSLLHLRPCQG